MFPKKSYKKFPSHLDLQQHTPSGQTLKIKAKTPLVVSNQNFIRAQQAGWDKLSNHDLSF